MYFVFFEILYLLLVNEIPMAWKKIMTTLTGRNSERSNRSAVKK